MEIGCRLRRVETAARARGYLHVIEPRVKGHIVIHEGQGPIGSERLRKIFKGKLMAAGGFEPDTAEETVRAGIADAVAFGRHFVPNPDLPHRIHQHLPLTPYDRNTFYTFDARGYSDYLPAPETAPDVRDGIRMRSSSI